MSQSNMSIVCHGDTGEDRKRHRWEKDIKKKTAGENSEIKAPSGGSQREGRGGVVPKNASNRMCV